MGMYSCDVRTIPSGVELYDRMDDLKQQLLVLVKSVSQKDSESTRLWWAQILDELEEGMNE